MEIVKITQENSELNITGDLMAEPSTWTADSCAIQSSTSSYDKESGVVNLQESIQNSQVEL